jgi:fatty acid desaturase
MQIPWRLNLVLAIAVFGVYLALYRGVELLGGRHFGLFVLVGAGFLVLTPTLWGLVHEGIHGRLLRQPLANRTASRVLCVLLGFSFETVQFGHLMHHRYNGHEYDRPDRMKPGEPAWKGWSRHWVHLLGGHYLFTALVGVVAFLPAQLRELALQRALSSPQPDIAAMHRAALKWCDDRERLARVRVDCLASAVVVLISFLHYAVFWPLLLPALYGRAVVYSTLDNLPHYGKYGCGDEAAMNLTLPRWACVLVLNHNLHRMHHERPNLPWRALPAKMKKAPSDGPYVLAAIRQFSGPIKTPLEVERRLSPGAF